MPDTGLHGICLAHGTQIMRQMDQVAIAGALVNQIRNRKSQPGSVQQPAHIANLAHRQDPWRQAARLLRLGLSQRGAQFVQGLTSKANGHEQAILGQAISALNDLPNRVIGPVQRHGVNHQVVALRRQVKDRLVRDHICGREPALPESREARDNGDARKRSVNLGEPILDLICRDAMQYIGPVCAQGPIALAFQCRSVGQRGAALIREYAHGAGT